MPPELRKKLRSLVNSNVGRQDQTAIGFDSVKIELKTITLFAPDELLSYWWISHDFAGELGLEYSSEAAETLKRVLGPLGAHVDYEADAVTLRITKKASIVPVIHTLFSELGWDDIDLSELEKRITQFKRPRPRSISVGDTFLVPITTETWGLGQVLALNYKAPTIAIYRIVGGNTELEDAELGELRLLTILHIAGNSLYKGEWPVLRNSPVLHDPNLGPGGKIFTVGSISFGGDGPVINLLLAYMGLQQWEQGYADPNYLRRLVLN